MTSSEQQQPLPGDEPFRMLVESLAGYAVCLLDLSGHVRTWNPGAENTTGYRAEEILGQHISVFCRPEDRAAGCAHQELESARREGRIEKEVWRLRKDGSSFFANFYLAAVHSDDGTLVGFAMLLKDLTGRSAAEEALRKSEERFRLMVQSVKDYAIIMLDPSGNVVSWNEGAQRIKGWTAEEIIGRNFALFYPEEDVRAGKTDLELREARRVGSFEDFGWRMRKDGTRFWANVIITALFDEAGELRGYSKVTRDITERRRAEQRLRRAYDELEAFSYSVSHDLRAPLRSLNGFSQVLATQYADVLDERGRDYLARIQTSAERMGRLIDDLLNLSRFGRVQMDIEQVDLSSIAAEIVADLRRAEPARQVAVDIEPSLRASGDASLLRVVLQNLLQNAWKYTSRQPAARIVFGARQDGGRQHYFVRDNGAGFDMAYADKLFGPFQRLHGMGEFPGTGIGLANVKRIVQRHGGEVFAEGEVGKGSTFSFTLGTPGDAR